MPVTVREETPLQEEVAALLRESDAFAAERYPGEYRRPISPETLAAAGILFLVARIDGVAGGCCALIEAGDGTAELKRMIVGEGFRRQGIASALLGAAETAAVARGIGVIRMEVGVRNTEGQALYRKAGYRERGPFAPYAATPISSFLEKHLGH